jgi:hypothetical protein
MPRGAAKWVRLKEYERHLFAAVQQAEFLSRMKFVLVGSSEVQRNGKFRIKVREVLGDSPVLMPAPAFESVEPLLARALYLLQETGPDIDLTPFWTIQDCAACGQAELCYLTRRTRRTFSFASFSTNHAFEDAQLPEQLGWFEIPAPSSQRFFQVREPASLAHPQRLRVPRSTGKDLINLPRIYEETQSSMVLAIHVDAKTGMRGWNHHVGLPSITAFSTAIGLRIMRLVTDDFTLFRSDEIVQTLWDQRLKGGCWKAKSQFQVGRPEASAAVLLALYVGGDRERARGARSDFERILLRSVDETLWRRVSSVAVVVPALATLGSRAAVFYDLVDVLDRAAVQDLDAGTMWWTAVTRLDPGFPAAQPSVAHTARAVLALNHCYRATNGDLGRSAQDLQPAIVWLLRQPSWPNTAEAIERPIDGYRTERLIVRHSTAAWAVRALLELDLDPTNERIRAAIGAIYGSQKDGLWDWEEIRRPIWATHDALRALTCYALRASPVPGTAA